MDGKRPDNKTVDKKERFYDILVLCLRDKYGSV